jgi:hypothetical protein
LRNRRIGVASVAVVDEQDDPTPGGPFTSKDVRMGEV